MKQVDLLKQKIGVKLSRIGMLSKAFAIQTFAKMEFEITPEQFLVLLALNDNPGMYQRQLSTLTFKDRPNITRIVSILEKGEYITSKNSSNGRQIKELYITEKGKDICNKILPVIFQVWEETTKGIEQEEINKFIDTLSKIETNLRENTYIQI